MSNQVSANRGVPADKLPSVKEPGDPARPVLVRGGEAGLETEGEGRRELPEVRRGDTGARRSGLTTQIPETPSAVMARVTGS